MARALQLKRPLIVFDLETTGTSPRFDRIIEFAAIKVMPDGSEIAKEWLLNPTVHIPEETTAIHGISDEIVKDCPTFADKAREIFDFFEGCDLSGFNSDHFDIPCLQEEFARVGLNLAANQRKHVDVQKIYRLKERRTLSDAVQKYCHRPHDGAHGAAADTRATLDVLKAQLDYYEDLPTDVDGLEALISPHDPLNADAGGLIRWKNGEWTINFGKKKGMSLKRIMLDEPRYLKWITNSDFDADVRAIAADALEGRLPPAPVLPTEET